MAPSKNISGINRREVLKGIVAMGMMSEDASANESNDANTSIMAAIASAEKLDGRNYTPAQRTLMIKSLMETEKGLLAIRNADILDGSEPAFHFDPRLAGMRYPEGKGSFKMSHDKDPAYQGDPESLAFATVVEISRLIKDRRISSVALAKMYIQRLKKYGPMLNCVITLTEELAMKQAEQADKELADGRYRGPLHGIPWGAKDLFATIGIPTTWGAKPYERQIFDFDATVVKRMEEAGAVLAAKLSMGELAMGDVWFGGKTRCPWNQKEGSSGSSAGPGAATAAGLVGFSLGTETLGSIVSPSVRNGTTGLRPTYGRVSRHGAMALCWTMDKIGPICRGVEDCALALNAIYGPDGEDPTCADIPFHWNPDIDLKTIKAGVDTAAFQAARKDKTLWPIYEKALETLGNLGLTLHPVEIPPENETYSALAQIIIGIESSAAFTRLINSGKLDELAQQTEDSWPNIFRAGSILSADDYITAQRVRSRLQREMTSCFRDIDCLITMPFANLSRTNLTGHPTLITRCGMQNGLPISIAFIGNLYREDAILRLGLAYERATHWHNQWPDTAKLAPLADLS